MFENSANIMGQRAKSLTTSTSAATTTDPLEPGVYAIWSAADHYISLDKTAAAAALVTTSGSTTGLKITANSPVMPIRVPSACFLGAIAGGSSTLYYMKVA